MDGQTDKRKDGRMDGRTDGLYFIGPFLPGPTSTAAVDPRHLKVEDVEQDFPNCPYVINRTCQNLMLIM